MGECGLVVGETCYVVSTSGLAASRLDGRPLDNGPLVGGEGLRRGLLEGLDYTVVRAGEWAQLARQYGGGPALARPVIDCQGPHLELAPLRLEVLVRGALPHTLVVRASRALPAALLLADLAALLHLPPAALALLAPGPAAWLPVPPAQPLGLVPLSAGRLLLTVAGPAPPALPPLPAPAPAPTPAPGPPGTTGLTNLGSSCYLNAAVQALAHTRPLLPYFLARYHLDLPCAPARPLAAEFGSLLAELWSGARAVAPGAFRAAVGAVAAGAGVGVGGQGDAQEVLALVVEALHEELGEAGRSPVATTFRGTLGSSLRCLACGRHSQTTDHFTHLSLPFPTTAHFPVLHSRRGPLDLHLPPHHTVAALALAVAAAAGGPVLLAQLTPTTLDWLPPSRRLARLTHPLLAYPVPPPPLIPVLLLLPASLPRLLALPPASPLAAVAAATNLPLSRLRGPPVLSARDQVRLVEEGQEEEEGEEGGEVVEGGREGREGEGAQGGEGEEEEGGRWGVRLPGPVAPNVPECLRRFVQAEVLGAGDQWQCPACACARPALKQLTVLQAPPALVLHLKRFRHLDGHTHKISAACAYPARLALPALPAPYLLYAVICHTGQLSGGHYTAYCAVPRPRPGVGVGVGVGVGAGLGVGGEAGGEGAEDWYLFNDGHVRPARPGEHMQPSNAYILFYRRI